MSHAVKLHHPLADVSIAPSNKVNVTRLKRVIRTALDDYLDEARVPADLVHAEAKARHGAAYRTPGYYLRLYRLRAELTQAELAAKAGTQQHHLSEMEHNKRPIGKISAKKLAKLLNCDYQKLL
ncbi:MAG TPA: helix-turn-helix transcriptional regulator [Acidiferrobacterales bacterium]|nr:helix-turn-helix transcriptional regulator [Acidiferrobacterales bacterium]